MRIKPGNSRSGEEIDGGSKARREPRACAEEKCVPQDTDVRDVGGSMSGVVSARKTPGHHTCDTVTRDTATREEGPCNTVTCDTHECDNKRGINTQGSPDDNEDMQKVDGCESTLSAVERCKLKNKYMPIRSRTEGCAAIHCEGSDSKPSPHSPGKKTYL